MLGNLSSTGRRHSGWSYDFFSDQAVFLERLRRVSRNSLQDSAIVPARLRLSHKALTAYSKHTPVLLEDSEVGSVVLLVVAIHIL